MTVTNTLTNTRLMKGGKRYRNSHKRSVAASRFLFKVKTRGGGSIMTCFLGSRRAARRGKFAV